MIDKNITIGIPTHKRPALLERALNSLMPIRNDIFIYISVDGKENIDEYKMIEQKYLKNKSIKFFYNDRIGSLKNFYFLRDICETKYFMWLADDDEISSDGILELFKFLEKNKEYVSACLYWELVKETGKRKLLEPEFFNDNSIFFRIIKYLAKNDDAFFYGLHRIETLKKASFKNYWWPNKQALSNWCYIFQFDILLNGKIKFLKNSKYSWVNHDYGIKYYPMSANKKIFKYLAFLIRKINMYYLYLSKILKNKLLLSFFIVLILSPFFLLRDLIFREPVIKKMKF